MSNTLAIVMPIKNRLTLTRQTIESLISTVNIPCKLILVADDCNKETIDYLYTLSSTDLIELIVIKSFKPLGPGKARNLGMNVAGEADYYYHTDCDMYFLDGWLEKLLTAYKDHKDLGVLGGRKHPHHGEIAKIFDPKGYDIVISDQQVGMSMLFSKEVWNKVKEKYGGFKDNGYSPHTMGQEDTAFCSQVQELGYKVGSISPAVVLHCGIKNTFGMDTAGHPEELQQPFPVGVLYGIYD